APLATANSLPSCEAADSRKGWGRLVPTKCHSAAKCLGTSRPHPFLESACREGCITTTSIRTNVTSGHPTPRNLFLPVLIYHPPDGGFLAKGTPAVLVTYPILIR